MAVSIAAAPVIGAEFEDVWNYDFESDHTGAITGYDSTRVVSDNHVYHLGTTALTKYTTLSGNNTLSFDFEYVNYYNFDGNNGGNGTFNVYLYRNGKGYQFADVLSTANSGKLMFNGAAVKQANGTSDYYLKN